MASRPLVRSVDELPLHTRLAGGAALSAQPSAAVTLTIPGSDAAFARWVRTNVTLDGVLAVHTLDDPAERATPSSVPTAHIRVLNATSAQHSASALRDAIRATHSAAQALAAGARDACTGDGAPTPQHPALQADVHAAHAMLPQTLLLPRPQTST